MKRLNLILLLWAIVTTLIILWFQIIPIMHEAINRSELTKMKDMPCEQQKAIIQGEIIKAEFLIVNLEKMRESYQLQYKLVRIDSSDITNLYNYGNICYRLYVNEDNTLQRENLMDEILWASRRIRHLAPYNTHFLQNAARLMIDLGGFNECYYDTAVLILDRAAYLFEVDSVILNENITTDTDVYYNILKGEIEDLKNHITWLRRIQQRRNTLHQFLKEH